MPVFPRFFQLLVSLMLITFPVSSQVLLKEDHIPGEALVQFYKPVDAVKFAEDVNASSFIGLSPKRLVSKTFNIWLFTFDTTISKAKLLHALYREKSVAKAQYNHRISERVIATPNDTYFTSQWDMNNTGQNSGIPGVDIDALQAWNVTTGGLTLKGDTIVVAVIDGGFALNHPDLNFFKNYQDIQGNGIDDDGNGYIDDYKGWNAYNQSGNVTNNNHGTHVSGTIGARGNNGIGVAGVNWNVKVLAVQGSTSQEATAVEAYSYVYDMRRLYDQTNGAKGAFVVSTNSSFGVDYGDPADYPIWCGMYDSLGKAGILSAAATANIRLNIDVTGDIPTACPSDYMISVTNTNNLDSLYSSAGYGRTTIDLGAPGTGIWSTTWPSSSPSYGPLTGTSMATPHVAGAIGLMYSIACEGFIDDYKMYPDSFAAIMKDLLLQSVDTIPALKNITVTEGRLNLHKSVNAVVNYAACLGITVDETHRAKGLKVYPNPASSFLTVENVIGSLCSFYDMSGRMIRSENVSENNTRFDISALSKGIYLVTFSDATSFSSVKLVVD